MVYLLLFSEEVFINGFNDFEPAVNFVFFHTCLKAARCSIKSSDNFEEVSPFMVITELLGNMWTLCETSTAVYVHSHVLNLCGVTQYYAGFTQA